MGLSLEAIETNGYKKPATTMKANKPAFCLPKSKFEVGDCVLCSEDYLDGIPKIYYRFWSKFLILGKSYVPNSSLSTFNYVGWTYEAIQFAGHHDGDIGRLTEDLLLTESEIRLIKDRPSNGFLAFFGLLWLPTDETANCIGITVKSLNRKKSSLTAGLHYQVDSRRCTWNVGEIAKTFGVQIPAPEIERSHRGRAHLRLEYPETGYSPVRGVFPVLEPITEPLITPVPATAHIQPLCG